MKVTVIRGKYLGASIVYELNTLINSNKDLDLSLVENPDFFNTSEINILVYDYTPIAQGNILIKRPGEKWEKLKLNSKIVNSIKKTINMHYPHGSNKSNILSSIRRSSINCITL